MYIAIIILVVAIIEVSLIKLRRVYAKAQDAVMQTSTRYQAADQARNCCILDPSIQSQYLFETRQKTKARYDSLQFPEYMMAVVEESPDYFQDILTRAAHNKKHEHNYIEAISQLPPPVTQETYSSCGVPYGLYRTIEKRLVRKLQIKAFPEEPEFRVTAYYTSPAGRNHYRKEQCFTCEDIQQMLDAFESNLEKTAYKQHQRSLMSAGLRYDIMKRDNFRCVICGRSAQDGVTLQVDHIIPVAKGGQTEPENLRTLCEDCNRGKSDKL